MAVRTTIALSDVVVRERGGAEYRRGMLRPRMAGREPIAALPPRTIRDSQHGSHGCLTGALQRSGSLRSRSQRTSRWLQVAIVRRFHARIKCVRTSSHCCQIVRNLQVWRSYS